MRTYGSHVKQSNRKIKPASGAKKRPELKVENLAKLLSELKRLREQVQKAEAVRGLR